jgi:hypothetical protein
MIGIAYACQVVVLCSVCARVVFRYGACESRRSLRQHQAWRMDGVHMNHMGEGLGLGLGLGLGRWEGS